MLFRHFTHTKACMKGQSIILLVALVCSVFLLTATGFAEDSMEIFTVVKNYNSIPFQSGIKEESLESFNIQIRMIMPKKVRSELLSDNTPVTVEKPSLAVLPFENLTDDPHAADRVTEAVRVYLSNLTGNTLLGQEETEAFLVRYRIRHRGYLSYSMLENLRRDTGVRYAVLGTVINYSASGNPELGVHVRVVDTDTGRILWAGFNSASGYDFESVLGLGIIRDINRLITVVVERLFKDFSLESDKEDWDRIKVAVVPFKNISTRAWAGRAVTYMLLTALWRTPNVEPVEYGQVKDLMIELKIRENGELNYQQIETLGRRLGVKQLMVGTVEEYKRGKGTPAVPEVTLSCRLLDVQTKRILSYYDQELDGDDEIVVLDFGRLRTADKVAYRVIGKLLKRFERRYW